MKTTAAHHLKLITYNLILIAALLPVLPANAQIPEGYYNSIDEKQERNLKTALSKTIVNHTVLRYNDLWKYYPSTDAKEDGRTIWDMYSNTVRYYSLTLGQSTSGIQREHSLPKSWWAIASKVEDYDAYSDLHHLYPSDGDANQRKSNYMLGEVANPAFDNGVSKVGKNAYNYAGAPAANAFEPDDEYKGDFARTYFYMITCYEDYAQQWRSDALNMFNKEIYPVLKPWAKDMLLKWHRNDPLSQKEINRNNEVYKVQKNRNPFIDYPQLVEYIWGDSVNYTFRLPVSSSINTIDSTSLDLYVEGKNIVFRTYEPATQVRIFNSFGRQIYRKAGTGDWQYYLCSKPGVYIVSVNNKARKIVVR